MMNLSESTNEVIGWDSKSDTKDKILVRDSYTQIHEENEAKVLDKNIGTQDETKEIGVQENSTILISNSNEETDKKLAAWLRKLMPALEKELMEGPTMQMNENRQNSRKISFAKVSEFQALDLTDRFSSDDLIQANFLWLSVVLVNNPVIIISCKGISKNGSTSSYLLLFEPYRNKMDGNIYWKEMASYPIKDHLEFLVVNSEDRDIFAGASRKGDVYIWQYNRASSTNSESQVNEIFSKTCDDSICGVTFLTDNNFLCCFMNDGVLVSYKIASKKNSITEQIIKVDQKIIRDVNITAITGITKDFVIGLLDGRLLYCSTIHDSQNPFVRELISHKFAVKKINHFRNSDNENFIVSFDVSNEMFIHEIEEETNEKSLKYVIRLPLPIKNSIAYTSNLEYIFCSSSNGNLEILDARKHTRKIIEENNSGTNVLAELSKNESWLMSGLYKGKLKIFRISYE